MPSKLAYLVAAKLKLDQPNPSCPKPEYKEFIDSNQTPLLDLNYVQRHGSALSRNLLSRGRANLALALAASENREYDRFLAAGEDIGLPLFFMNRLKLSSKPIFMITHGSYFRSPKFKALLNFLKKDSRVHFLCLSESLRQTMIARFGMPESQVHNPSYGVDINYFSPQVSQSTVPVIASAGTATRDYRTLVEASSGLKCELKIAADSAWFPTLIDIDRDKLPANVEAKSYGDYAGLKQLYADSQFVVVPLYPAKHACGYAVIIEAMAMGRTVIATRTESHSDFIIDGENGFYVEPGDVAGLREKMSLLLNEPELAKNMGDAARKRIVDHFSLQTYARKLAEIANR